MYFVSQKAELYTLNTVNLVYIHCAHFYTFGENILDLYMCRNLHILIHTQSDVCALFFFSPLTFTFTLLSFFPFQHLPDCHPGSSWGSDPRAAAVGESSNRRSACHSAGLQPPWPGHHGEASSQPQRVTNLRLAFLQIPRHRRWDELLCTLFLQTNTLV